MNILRIIVKSLFIVLLAPFAIAAIALMLLARESFFVPGDTKG